MKNEAMKRTGGRRKSSQSDYPLKGKKTVEIIGEEFGDSAKQVQRYLKLTDLVPELLEKLDNGELSFNPAVELSYLTIEEQKEFIDAMEYTHQIIMPIVSSSGDCIGSIVLISKESEMLSEGDEKILKIAANFLGKQVQ